MAFCHVELGPLPAEDEMNVLEINQDSIKAPVMARDQRPLAKEEIQQNAKQIAAGKIKELMGLHELDCFDRMPKTQSKNRVYTRCIITW